MRRPELRGTGPGFVESLGLGSGRPIDYGPMKRTRLSLYYLVGYLSFGGIGLLFFPRLSLDLFMSTVAYEIPMVRLVAILLIALAVIVVQVIRYQAEQLYPTTLLVRALILGVLIWQYSSSGDPFFLILTGIVGLGLLITATCYLSEKR